MSLKKNCGGLEVETWCDAKLSHSGQFDSRNGGTSAEPDATGNRRRTCYAPVSGRDLTPLLRLLDFLDPSAKSGDLAPEQPELAAIGFLLRCLSPRGWLCRMSVHFGALELAEDPSKRVHDLRTTIRRTTIRRTTIRRLMGDGPRTPHPPLLRWRISID